MRERVHKVTSDRGEGRSLKNREASIWCPSAPMPALPVVSLMWGSDYGTPVQELGKLCVTRRDKKLGSQARVPTAAAKCALSTARVNVTCQKLRLPGRSEEHTS